MVEIYEVKFFSVHRVELGSVMKSSYEFVSEIVIYVVLVFIPLLFKRGQP